MDTCSLCLGWLYFGRLYLPSGQYRSNAAGCNLTGVRDAITCRLARYREAARLEHHETQENVPQENTGRLQGQDASASVRASWPDAETWPFQAHQCRECPKFFLAEEYWSRFVSTELITVYSYWGYHSCKHSENVIQSIGFMWQTLSTISTFLFSFNTCSLNTKNMDGM